MSSQPAILPVWFRMLIITLAVVAGARGLALIEHSPLLALANNYDQIRYTACLDLAPWRPGVPAETGSPQAPLARFVFQPLPMDLCVWTSDLLFSAPVAQAWRLSEVMGGRAIHSIRRLGEWRLLCLLLVAGWATVALLRADRPDIAAAHLAWLALFGLDPANVIYFSTFYAEAAATIGFYFCAIGVAVALVRPTRGALLIAALGAAILGASKFQHIVLPLLLGGALLIGAGSSARKVVLAVIVGGVLGLVVQVGNSARATPIAHAISAVNRADFALLVLLPETSDRDRVVAALDMSDSCLAYIGKSVYAMPGAVENTCPNVGAWSRATLWWLLISDPPALVAALTHIPTLLLPWLPGLGLVEGGHYTPLPRTVPSWSSLFGDNRAVASGLLLLPWCVFVACLLRRAWRRACGFALMCAVGSTAVAVIALFGDGDVEFAKHAQLSINYALASLGLVFAVLARRALQRGVQP
ncbi:MAG: hypothetical protein ABI082_01770 [Dokdonella sp.]